MEKKYEILNIYGSFRIKALKDFQLITGEIIKAGDLGGRVDGEHNLSQEGNCWINLNAIACHNSRIKDSAVLEDYSVARDNSTVSDNAVLKDHSIAYDNSTISGYAVMNGDSRTCDNSTISGNAVLKDCSCAEGNSTITGNALLQARQRIKFGTVTTDLLGTKDWIGALYAELGVVPNDNKVVLYKKVWKTDEPDVFESDYDRNLLYKIGKISRVRKVDEDIFKSSTRGLHFTSLEFAKYYDGDVILECEVEVNDIITILNSQVRARKCRVLRVYKEE